MHVSLLDREDTTPTEFSLTVEMRATTLAEMRSIDVSRSGAVLPAYLLMTEAEWRHGIGPYVSERRHSMPHDRHGPPGSLIWAQSASRAGHVMVGGRDRLGFPSFPVPASDGVIRFESLDSPDVDLSGEAGIPIVRGYVLDEPATCTPLIDPDDSISCASADCAQCLHSISLSPWQSAIACLCREHPDSPRRTRHQA